MSNPSNETDLTELTILMAVPPTAYGETLSTQPPGGVWNKEKGSVVWCVTGTRQWALLAWILEEEGVSIV